MAGQTGAPAGSAILISLSPDVQVQQAEEDAAALVWPEGRVTLRRVGQGLRTALADLAGVGLGEAELSARVAGDGPEALMRLYYNLERWRQLRLLRYTVHDGARRLLHLVPYSHTLRLSPAAAAGPVRLSRFAYWRREGAGLALESPLAPCRLDVEAEFAARLMPALLAPLDAAGLAAAAGVSAAAADAVMRVLQTLGFAQPADAAGDGEGGPALAQWEFQDLLFHARTRGRSPSVAAGSFRFAGSIEPPPAVRPAHAGVRHGFDRPDPERLGEGDPPFGRVLEARRSIRHYGQKPITAAQLGEFLYRAARVRHVFVPQAQAMPGYQLSSRPYPSGGSSYELELYPIVAACDGLDAGLYHYDPAGHALTQVAALTPQVQILLAMAAAGTGEPGFQPQVVISVAARFPRVTWKYERVAYSLILKDVGVLYQSMYLVATAMGLAPCALGGGDSDLFAEAAGTDYLLEGSVGDFLLGSRAPD